MSSEHPTSTSDVPAQQLEAVHASQETEQSEADVTSIAPTVPTGSSRHVKYQRFYDYLPGGREFIPPMERADITPTGSMYGMPPGSMYGIPPPRSMYGVPPWESINPPTRRDADETPKGSTYGMPPGITGGTSANATPTGSMYGIPPPRSMYGVPPWGSISPPTRRDANETPRGSTYGMPPGMTGGTSANATPTGSMYGVPPGGTYGMPPGMTGGRSANATPTGSMYGMPPGSMYGIPPPRSMYGIPLGSMYTVSPERMYEMPSRGPLTRNGMDAGTHLTSRAGVPPHQRSGHSAETRGDISVSHMPVGLQSIKEVPPLATSVLLSPVLEATQPDTTDIVAEIPEGFSVRQVSPAPTPAPSPTPNSHQFEDGAFPLPDKGHTDTPSSTSLGVVSQDAGIDLMFSRSSSRMGRRSESSDGSSASSSFREYSSSSSSSSGSGSGSGSGCDDERKQNLDLNPSTNLAASSSTASRMVKQVLNIGKTQRLVRRYVAELGNLDPDAQTTASRALLRISRKNDRGHQEVVRRLTKGKKNRQSTLEHLFRLADYEAYSSPNYCRLLHTTSSAELIGMIFSDSIIATKLVASMSIYLRDSTVLDGAAGVQYTLERWRYLILAIPSAAVILRGYVERVLVETPNVTTSHTFSISLLELMLREGMTHTKELSDSTLDHITSTLGPPISYSTLASLHLVRAMDLIPLRILLSGDIIDSLMFIMKHDSDQLTKRLAFSTLAKFMPYEPNRVNRAMDLAMDVLLWTTNWQHYHSGKKKEKLWDGSTIVPHDDAYRILCHIPPSDLINALKSRFQSHQLALRSEPLLALVVERSKTLNPLWPRTLSSLIQAGVIDFLIRIAQQSLPDDLGHRDYRVIHVEKRDALITVVRIFEQMMAKDVQCIGADIPSSLKSLVNDTSQPLSVQWQAKTALQWWNRLHGIEQTQKPDFRPA
ncbi:hypothetical protein FRB95_014143 [Tulasnella sp. JGI-2019a]|nr:hypothetical protein FRB95_014143 [Tulasnella sp. JGI-2019a]